MKVRDIVVEMWKRCGGIGEYDVPDGNQTIYGLTALNESIALMNLSGLFSHTSKVETCSSPNALLMTIGVDISANINATRPAKIRAVYFNYPNSAPLSLTEVAFKDIFKYRGSPNAVGSPAMYAYKPDYPLGQIHFDRIPASSGTITVIYNSMIERVAIDDILTIPEEYFSALSWMGASKLASRNGMESFGICKSGYDDERAIIEANTMSNTPPTVALMSRSGMIARRNVITG